MATNKLSLYNGALQMLGARKLASLTENQLSRRELDSVFSRGGVKTCLSFGQFKFAVKTILWDASPSIEPDFGYQYGFDKPTDWVRTVGVSTDEYFENPLLQYKDEAGFIWASITPIYFSFVSDDVLYGFDYAKWPENFSRMTECYFAKEVCLRLTQSASLKEDLEGAFKKLKTESKATDAMDGSTQFLPTGSWVRARRGSGTRERGTRGQLIG